MALVTVTNLSANPISCDVGLVKPGMSVSVTMGPNEAYRAAAGLKTLVDAGKVSVVVTQEAALLDSLEPAEVSTASVADGAVTTAKLTNLAVTTAKLADASVTAVKIADGVVSSTKLASASVTAGAIAVGGVSAANQLASGVVTNSAIAAGSVQASNIVFFKSTEQTGTGSSQNIAHGLGSVPGLVFVQVTGLASATDTFVEGAHDSTNVKMTVSAGAKFKVVAVK